MLWVLVWSSPSQEANDRAEQVLYLKIHQKRYDTGQSRIFGSSSSSNFTSAVAWLPMDVMMSSKSCCTLVCHFSSFFLIDHPLG